MPVARMSFGVALLCALLTMGCRGEPPNCPVGSVIADPMEIPAGSNETSLIVEVSNPFPQDGYEIVTELSSLTGTIEDPFALATTYACAFDVSGEVEVCVTTTYELPDADAANTSGLQRKRRGPNVYISNPLECSTTKCTAIVCPESKNLCPEVSSLTIDPDTLEEGELAEIEVVANDPDDNPEPLTTSLSARHGTIADPSAAETTYACDPEVGGVIPICVDASDGACTETVCESVRCPGTPLENTCPIVESVTADPNPIESPSDLTTVRVSATDPDEFPQPMKITWSSEGGGFENRNDATTVFRCGEPGPVDVSVNVSDGDTACDQVRDLVIECPSDVRSNLCPMLFVINGVPRTIPSGETTTRVETRGQDTDGLPVPLTLTLSALWGTFENTVNIQEPNNVVAQNATYVCSRPGPVEVCVDASDGACTKTLCTVLTCPDDVPTP